MGARRKSLMRTRCCSESDMSAHWYVGMSVWPGCLQAFWWGPNYTESEETVTRRQNAVKRKKRKTVTRVTHSYFCFSIVFLKSITLHSQCSPTICFYNLYIFNYTYTIYYHFKKNIILALLKNNKALIPYFLIKSKSNVSTRWQQKRR